MYLSGAYYHGIRFLYSEAFELYNLLLEDAGGDDQLAIEKNSKNGHVYNVTAINHSGFFAEGRTCSDFEIEEGPRNITLENCFALSSEAERGIFLDGGDVPLQNITLRNCEVANTAGNEWCRGIHLVRTEGFNIVDCYIHDIAWRGLEIYLSTQGKLEGVVIDSYHYGIGIKYSSDINFLGGKCTNGRYGIWLKYDVDRCHIKDYICSNNSEVDISISDSDSEDNIIEDCYLLSYTQVRDRGTRTVIRNIYNSLPLSTGILAVDSSPFSVECFVDGVSWAFTPQSREVEVGNYTVSWADVEGYYTPTPQTVEVFENSTTSAIGVYEELIPLTTSLSCEVFDMDTTGEFEVLVNGNLIYSNPRDRGRNNIWTVLTFDVTPYVDFGSNLVVLRNPRTAYCLVRNVKITVGLTEVVNDATTTRLKVSEKQYPFTI
jgi:hypothetical protein